MAIAIETLRRRLSEASDPAAWGWLQALVDGDAPLGELAVRTAFARCGRSFGETPLADELVGWTRQDAARALLLVAACARRPADAHVELALSLLRGGEIGEQVSLLRALDLLPEPARFVALAREAARTNAVPVFTALACGNPFVRHLPAEALRQLVLKAIFLGVPVADIVDLRARVDAELVRMLGDYAAERRAAGREVPADVTTTIAMYEGRP